MPNGEWRSAANVVRNSGSPLPSESRSSVMRSALGVADPARFIASPMIAPLMPVRALSRSGAFVSATSTSPLGSTYNHRG